MVTVNVAALSPTLAEAELFGHAEGTFSGAVQNRTGLLLQANGGTLFLDEVADIPPALQLKLLRVLDHGEVLPVGADAPLRSRFRVISATTENLRKKVEAGEFRHDLYFRLCTFEIDLPPLREPAGGYFAARAPLRFAVWERIGGACRRNDCRTAAAGLGMATCASCATRSSTRWCSPGAAW